MSNEIKVIVYKDEQYGSNWFPEDAKSFMSWMKSKIKSIPSAYRDEAEIEFDSYESYGSNYVTLEIYYYRTETKEEIKDRKDRYKNAEYIKKNNDIAEFERLKKRYNL